MKKILLIEDNKGVRENLTEILQLANYNALAAADGKQGIKMIKKENPDLIICDIMMPVLDGYGVLQIMSKDPQHSTIPFIFLSAKNDHADIRKGMDLGADDFLRKPVQGEDLLKAVETRLIKSEIQKTQFAANNKNGGKITASTIIDLNAEELELITCSKGHLIYRAGSRPSHLFYVVKGKLKNFKITEDGNELITSVLKEGDFFGYNSLLEGSAYTDNVETLENAELKLIPKDEFLSLMFSGNETANQFIRLLTKNISEKEEQLVGLAYNSLRKRVADGVLYLHGKYTSNTGDKTKFKISRQNLANVTGASKESVIRVISDFKREKLIDIKDGDITVLKEDKLRGIFN